MLWSILVWLFWYVALPSGLAYLGGKLLAQDLPEAEDEIQSSQSYGWNPHVTQTEGIPRPRAYGKNMHYGNITAKWVSVSSSREKLHMIIDHGDGPTKGVGNNTIYLDDQPLNNFSGVTTYERRGTMNQTVIPGFEKTRLDYNLNAELFKDRPIYFTTPNDFFDDIIFNICFPNGMFYYHSDGGLRDGMAHIEVNIKTLHSGGGWTQILDEHLEHCTFSPHFYSYKVSDLYNIERGKQYKLSFNRSDTPAASGANNMYIKSVQEVIDIPFTRPGKALLGISAIATEQLSGNLDVKVVREDRIINTYDGTNWILKYSRNRAWIVWDILTQPVIVGDGGDIPYSVVRYEGIDPQHLDLEFFHTWADFCEVQVPDGYGEYEDRCACDLIVDDFTDIFTLAHRIAEVGRAHIYWSGHILTGWIDTTAPVVDLVTMDNIMHKTWKNVWAVKDELAGVAEVFYKDSRQGYERMSADSADEDAGGFRNAISLEGEGITTRGAALHYAYYLLERNRLIRNTNQFQVYKDGFRYKLGDVIRLQCKIANWGHAFRVISSTINTVTVDRSATSEINGGDVLHVRSYDTMIEEVVTDSYIVESVVDKVITVTENWDFAPIKGNLIAIGSVEDIKLRRITKLEPTADNYFNVTVETYDSDLFLTDAIDPDCPNRNYVWPGPTIPTISPVTRAEIEAINIIAASASPPIINFTPILTNVKWDDEEIKDSFEGPFNWITGSPGNTGPQRWGAMSFKTTKTYKVTAIEIPIMRYTSFDFGTLVAGIRNVNQPHFNPIGEDLCVGSILATSIPAKEEYQWVRIPIVNGAELEFNTEYSIVVRTPVCDPSSDIYWTGDGVYPDGYSNGHYDVSDDWGVTWLFVPGYEFMDLCFRVCGECVSWESFDEINPILFRILGVTYEITPGSTTSKYVYWDPNFPTVFCSTNDLNIAIMSGNWMVCINDDGTAYPQNMGQFIHGGTLVPESVPTESIQDNATSNSQHAYDASSQELPAGSPGAWTDIITLNITTIGGNVQVSFSFNTDQAIDLKVLRDSDLVWESPSSAVIAANSYFSFQVLDVAPAAGDYIYHLQGRTNNSASVTNVVARSLTCIEFRK